MPRPSRFGARRTVLAILALAGGMAGLAASLPDDPYQRWQSLDGTIHARARWIYERVHFDPTPIDVAFVGPSRVGAGVDAPRLGAALAARGTPAEVVNFSLPETGRNINTAIVEEMLVVKRPRLLVIGVIEKPSRFGHSAFKYVAPRALVADLRVAGPLSYLSDLAYLPFRQLRLFAARIAPDDVGLDRGFDPTRYPGPSVDTTGDVVLPDGTVKNGTRPASAEELARGVAKLEAGMNPPLLPRSLADWEFADERRNIRRIAAAARAKGVRVTFLALPYHRGPATLQEGPFYARFGPIWSAAFMAPHAQLYSDYGHLTAAGADILTDRLAAPVSVMLADRP